MRSQFSYTELFSHRLSYNLSPLFHKCSVSVFSLTMNFPFVIDRHLCCIYIYLAVTIIFTFVACTITFSLKRTCFSCFLLSFGGLGHFAIMWSSDPHLKHFLGVRSIFLLDETSSARALYFSFLILLIHFFAEWL